MVTWNIIHDAGYVVGVLGPFPGRVNDASILKKCLTNNQEFSKFLHNSDARLIVDRGFRDSVDAAKQAGLVSHLPAFLSKSQKQHTTFDANSSRLVTKVRWVVESANARFKKFKFFARNVPIRSLPTLNSDLQIISAFINAFRPKIKTDSPTDTEVAKAMLRKLNMDNDLEAVLEKGTQLDSRKQTIWKKMKGSTVLDFPELSEGDLQELTFGCYQTNMAKEYCRQHVDSESGEKDTAIFI